MCPQLWSWPGYSPARQHSSCSSFAQSSPAYDCSRRGCHAGRLSRFGVASGSQCWQTRGRSEIVWNCQEATKNLAPCIARKMPWKSDIIVLNPSQCKIHTYTGAIQCKKISYVECCRKWTNVLWNLLLPSGKWGTYKPMSYNTCFWMMSNSKKTLSKDFMMYLSSLESTGAANAV